MEKKNWLTKRLAVTGTVLACFPIVAPIVLSAIFSIYWGMLRFDYLMPAELFPCALAGGGLLLWAALRAKRRQGLVGWGLAAAVILLLSVQGLAVVTGLATGETAPGGWQWALVLAALVLYTLAVIAMGIGGILLTRDVFRKNTGG